MERICKEDNGKKEGKVDGKSSQIVCKRKQSKDIK